MLLVGYKQDQMVIFLNFDVVVGDNDFIVSQQCAYLGAAWKIYFANASAYNAGRRWVAMGDNFNGLGGAVAK